MSDHPNIEVIRSGYRAIGEGDMAGFAGILADDIVWHESMPGFEGTYKGKEEALGLLGRAMTVPGLSMDQISASHILADDTHAAVILEVTMTLDGRTRTSRFVDLYGMADGTLTEHWHLPFDPQGEAEFLAR